MKIFGKFLLYIMIIFVALITVIPFIYMIATAFETFTYVMPFPPRIIPINPTTQNFIDAWKSNNFQLYFKNSLVVATVTMIFSLFLSSLTAYAFARFEFPAKEFIFGLMLFTMMVPGMISLIPLFTLVKSMNLLNTYTGLYIIYVSGSIAFQTFLLRGFFEEIPQELEDSVYIDGGNRWTVYRYIILPLSKPALATIAIFSFLGAWDEFFWALTILKDQKLRTLPIAIAIFHGQYATKWGLIFAASLIAIIPVITIFVSFQKYFVRGLMSGALKG